ncbi:MAG: phosphopantetheine-binding protein [Bacteroidota bacterium]
MDLKTFTARVAVEFEFENEDTNIGPSTEFKQLESWSSMLALILIATLNDEYGVLLSESDLKTIETIEQLYDKVVASKSD